MQIRKRSKLNNIPFDLEISDIVIPEVCPYIGMKLTRIGGKGRVWTNPSIDKIIPSLGYVKGNIRIISMLANKRCPICGCLLERPKNEN